MSSEHQSILLILPYFGKFDNLFPFFLKSCENNSTINWLIVTDDKTEYNYPPNVKVVYITFNELRARINQLFDFEIKLNAPYKLCDYKPVYGEVFKDYVVGYDFWGYCDNDLIFGDIRSFLTDDILLKSNKVLSRGHLSLYRNIPYMNRFVFENTNEFYKTVYTSDKGFSFDEWGTHGIANHLKRVLEPDLFWDGLPFDDIWCLSSNFVPVQKRDQKFKSIIYEYENGTLIRHAIKYGNDRDICSEPVLYAHFQKRALKIDTSNTEHYLIIPNKVISPRPISLKLIQKYGKRKHINIQYLKIKYRNLRRKLKNIL